MDPCGALMALQIISQQITLQTKLRQRTEVEGPLDGVMVCTRVQLTRPLTNAFKDQCLASSAVRRCGAASHWCAPVRCVNPQTFQNTTKHFSVFLAQSQIPFCGANLLAGSDVMFLTKKEEARLITGHLCKGQHYSAEPPSNGLCDCVAASKRRTGGETQHRRADFSVVGDEIFYTPTPVPQPWLNDSK